MGVLLRHLQNQSILLKRFQIVIVSICKVWGQEVCQSFFTPVLKTSQQVCVQRGYRACGVKNPSIAACMSSAMRFRLGILHGNHKRSRYEAHEAHGMQAVAIVPKMVSVFAQDNSCQTSR